MEGRHELTVILSRGAAGSSQHTGEHGGGGWPSVCPLSSGGRRTARAREDTARRRQRMGGSEQWQHGRVATRERWFAYAAHLSRTASSGLSLSRRRGHQCRAKVRRYCNAQARSSLAVSALQRGSSLVAEQSKGYSKALAWRRPPRTMLSPARRMLELEDACRAGSRGRQGVLLRAQEGGGECLAGRST